MVKMIIYKCDKCKIELGSIDSINLTMQRWEPRLGENTEFLLCDDCLTKFKLFLKEGK